MKKFTFSFIVKDEVIDEIQNDLLWGEWGNVFNTLEEECEDSSHSVEEYEG